MSSELPFKYREAALRSGELPKDVAEERLLDELNRAVAPLEPTEPLSREAPEPLVFVLGLHRSGTTLLTQVLAQAFDVGYVNNLIARFWRAPVTGIRLSRQILGDRKEISYTSTFGKTADVSEPHEFSYFWHHWLRMEEMPPYYPDRAASEIDWSGLSLALRNMAWAFGRPLLMKAFDAAYHLERMAALLPEALFVLTRRDLADVCVSLRKARIAYYGNPDTWLGSYPVEYERIARLEDHEQIASQVHYLDAMLERGVAALAQSRKLVVGLDELCADPTAVASRISEASGRLCGRAPRRAGALPQGFRFTTFEGTPEHRAFARILRALRAGREPGEASA